MSKYPLFECLLLDLDGTLIDSTRLIVSAVKHAAQKAGKKIPSTREVIQAYAISASPGRILRRFRIYETEQYWNYYQTNIGKLVLFDRKIRTKLHQIFKSGVKIGLVTSLPRDIVRLILRRFRLSRIFSVVKTYEWRAPKWKLIDNAVSELDVERYTNDKFFTLPRRVLYVGDTAADIKAAKRADRGTGIWAGAACWGRKVPKEFSEVEPDFIFRNFDEVVLLLTTRIKSKDDYFAPSRQCYKPHPNYLPEKIKVNRRSCRDCFFPSDCLNCRRFEKVVRLGPSNATLENISKQIGVSVISCEWYYPRNYPPLKKHHDSIDTRNVISAFKPSKSKGAHWFRFRLALSMARRLKKLQEDDSQYRDIDVIVPVPSTGKKIGQRGYNPPEELSKVLSQLSKIPVSTDCLSMTAKRSRRATRYYYDWEDDKRRLMKNIHLRNTAKLAGKKILLIDDILTDGVTLSAYAEKIVATVRPKPEVVALTFGLTRKKR